MLGILRRARWWCVLVGTGVACAWAPAAWAQPGIYTCVDAQGRRLSSDRPIPECLDREQKQLGPTGTVRRHIGPSLSPLEQAAKEEEERKAAAEARRQAEERRRERALLARYPNQASHDAERARALGAIEEVIRAGRVRVEELLAEQRAAEEELARHDDPSKAPAKLKRELEVLERNIAAQERFIRNQEEEKRRVNSRFDEELARLRVLWARQQSATQPPAVSAAPAATDAGGR